MRKLMAVWLAAALIAPVAAEAQRGRIERGPDAEAPGARPDRGPVFRPDSPRGPVDRRDDGGRPDFAADRPAREPGAERPRQWDRPVARAPEAAPPPEARGDDIRENGRWMRNRGPESWGRPDGRADLDRAPVDRAAADERRNGDRWGDRNRPGSPPPLAQGRPDDGRWAGRADDRRGDDRGIWAGRRDDWRDRPRDARGIYDRGRNDRDWNDRGLNGRGWNRGLGNRGFDDRGYGDRGRWDRGWRGESQYNWARYRDLNRGAFRLPRYYAPYDWTWGYRRFDIGVTLSDGLWGQNYWISDPYAYRLPEVYGPYRWVRYYNDALLVDLESGEVVDAVYGIFW